MSEPTRVPCFPNRCTPNQPVVFDPAACNGCNRCVNACQMDLLMPNPRKGEPPIILYPEECWYEGSCVEHCPKVGAIRLNHPLVQRVRWRRRDSGEDFRL